MCAFLRTRHGVSRTHRARAHRTPAFGIWAQCAMLHRRPRARPLAACTKLYRLSRRLRFLSQEADGRICVVSRAFLNGGCTCASEGLFISPSFVDVPDETVTAPAVCHGDVQPPAWPMTTPLAKGERHRSPRPFTRDC